jgi:hypothetical protein
MELLQGIIVEAVKKAMLQGRKLQRGSDSKCYFEVECDEAQLAKFKGLYDKNIMSMQK